MREHDENQRHGRDLWTIFQPDGSEVVRLYGADSSDTSFERVQIGVVGNEVVIDSQAGPDGGTARDIVLRIAEAEVGRFTAGGLVGGSVVSAGVHGGFVEGYVTEEVTLSTTGATKDSASNLFPANSEILRCVWLITEAVDNVTSLIVGLKGGDADGLVTSQTTLAEGTSGVGIGALTNTFNAAAAKAVFTTAGGTQNTTGKVRLTVFYRQYTVPTA